MTNKITVTSVSGSVFEIDSKTIIDVHYSLSRQRTIIITKETEYIVRESVAQVKRKVKQWKDGKQLSLDL